MGIVSRFLLFLYTLFFALVALGILVLTTGLVPTGDVAAAVAYWSGRMETVVGAAVLFLVSIELMASGCFSGSKNASAKESVIVHGAQGDVNISAGAILETVERLAREVSGVCTVKPKVRFRKVKDEYTVLLHLDLGIAPESSAVAIANQLQKNIKEHLAVYMGLNDLTVTINVDGIRQMDKKRRVV